MAKEKENKESKMESVKYDLDGIKNSIASIKESLFKYHVHAHDGETLVPISVLDCDLSCLESFTKDLEESLSQAT
jgi:hypothetical protein